MEVSVLFAFVRVYMFCIQTLAWKNFPPKHTHKGKETKFYIMYFRFNSQSATQHVIASQTPLDKEREWSQTDKYCLAFSVVTAPRLIAFTKTRIPLIGHRFRRGLVAKGVSRAGTVLSRQCHAPPLSWRSEAKGGRRGGEEEDRGRKKKEES